MQYPQHVIFDPGIIDAVHAQWWILCFCCHTGPAVMVSESIIDDTASVCSMFGYSEHLMKKHIYCGIVLIYCLHCLQISRCTCGCCVRCGPIAHQQHGSVATDKLSEDENDVTGIHYGLFLCSHVLLYGFWLILGYMTQFLYHSYRLR